GMMEWWLSESGPLGGVVHAVDARHAPTPHGVRMVSYLAELGLPTLVVLNKIDKRQRMQREKPAATAVAHLGVDPGQLLPFSARTGEGREELLEAIEELVAQPPRDLPGRDPPPHDPPPRDPPES